jgi:receptor expression-enhancing protein 5/6
MEKVFELLNSQGAFVSKYGLIIGIIAVMLGIGTTYITCALGVAYPAFMSFLALESDGADDDKQWLTYWVIFGIFNVVDQWSGFILHFIPFYFFLKLAFLVFLFHPSTLGATKIYNAYILPYMEKYESQIKAAEQKLSKVGEGFSDLSNKAKSKVMGGDASSAPASEEASKKED